MKKVKQITYTVILLATCLVASPKIYSQIWKNSKDKAAPAQKKEVTVDIHSNSQTTPAPVSQTITAPVQENTQPVPSETVPAESASAPAETTTQPVTEPPQPQVAFVESSPEYFDDALFIGDSRTVGIRDYGTLSNADYFCDVGLSTVGAANSVVDGMSLNDTLASKKYGKVYVMLGINEVGNDIEYTASAYRQLIDTIKEKQPDAIIYVEANLHVSQLSQTSVINNERIEVNSKYCNNNTEDSRSQYQISI